MKTRIALAILLGGTAAASAQVRIESAVDRPMRLPWNPATPRELRAPPGFMINAFATGLGAPRMMAIGGDGTVYVTRGDSGDVVALRDRNGDGVADDRRVVVSGLKGVHGIALDNGRMYLATVTSVYVADILGSSYTRPRMILDGLPNGGQHSRRTLAIGPDRALYISVGSTCNDCVEVNPENATIIRASLDGRSRTVYARGLRNTIGWGWAPGTTELWGWDQGFDFRGNDLPPEEFNRIYEGGNYGWPFCYGAREADPYVHYDPPGGQSVSSYCSNTEGAALTYAAHSSPIGMAFYTASQFPQDYRGDAFVAFHGSWNRSPAAPAKIVRVRFQNGRPFGTEDFVTGFLTADGRTLIGRPAGIVVAADGSLLVTDDANGAIYRIAFGGGQGSNPTTSNTPTSSAGATRAEAQMRDATGRDLGTLSLMEASTGIDITGTLRGVPPGLHGIHIHSVGQCTAPFTSAGPHWNPSDRQHGTQNPQGPHWGDMLNISSNGAGVAVIRVSSQGGTMSARTTTAGPRRIGQRTVNQLSLPGLLDADGAAVVIHAEPDDYHTDPSGNSGARIACGVIVPR